MQPLIRLCGEQRQALGRDVLVMSHGLADQPLFGDDALVELLDQHPRERLLVRSTGEDPTRLEDNQLVVHDGVSGEELLRAVYDGRLSLDVIDVDRSQRVYHGLVRTLYRELGAQVPGFVPRSTRGTLLISSPGVVDYYRVDAAPSLLWHVRGDKRVWVYPALDPTFVRPETLEDIFAEARDVYVPHQPALDAHAKILDLPAGTVASWPQNAPHRAVSTRGVNVSLSTEHTTDESRARARLYSANRFLRQRIGVRSLSTAPRGARAAGKVALHIGARLIGLDEPAYHLSAPTLRVDARRPRGVVSLAEVAPAPQLVVREATELAMVRPYRAAIDDLNRRATRPCPFSTFDYIAGACTHDETCGTPEEGRLAWLLAFDGDELVGHLPMRRCVGRVLGRAYVKLELLTAGDADRPHLVAPPKDAQRVRDAFLRHLALAQGCDAIELLDQDDASVLRHVPELVRRRYHVREVSGPANTFIRVRWESLADYGRDLSKKFRGNLLRSLRRLLAAGEVELVRAEGPELGPRLFEHYLDVEARSWKHAAGGSIQRHPERLAWFRELVRAEQPFPMQVNMVTLDGVPIGGMLTGTFAGTSFALQTCYEEQLADLAPGQLLFLSVIGRAIDERLTAVNLLHGSSYYKERWLAEVAPATHLQILRKGSLPHLRAVAGELKGRMVRRLDVASPAVFNAKKRSAILAMSPRAPELARRRSELAALLGAEPKIVRLRGERLEGLIATTLERGNKQPRKKSAPEDAASARASERDALEA